MACTVNALDEEAAIAAAVIEFKNDARRLIASGRGALMTTLPDEEIKTLSDEQIKTIVTEVAMANGIPTQGVSTSTIMDSSGQKALKVVISIPASASLLIVGASSSSTVVTLTHRLADAGEDRFPIVQFEEKSSAP
jgi:hypothetical protein